MSQSKVPSAVKNPPARMAYCGELHMYLLMPDAGPHPISTRSVAFITLLPQNLPKYYNYNNWLEVLAMLIRRNDRKCKYIYIYIYILGLRHMFVHFLVCMVGTMLRRDWCSWGSRWWMRSALKVYLERWWSAQQWDRRVQPRKPASLGPGSSWRHSG